jgi:nitrate reductase cytochrome c-type subunit
LLEADGQPPFADAEQQPPMIPSSLRSLEISSQSRQDELLAALLSIVIHMDQELRAQQQVLAQVRRKLRQQST